MKLISSTIRRSLKIEAEGDAWKKRIKPKIRLTGRWLEQAGFKPGHRVEVTCVAPGVMELRFAPVHAAQDGGRLSAELSVKMPAQGLESDIKL